MPRKTFTAGEVLAAADVNTFLMDQSVMTFADSAARGSAIGTATEGMLTYLADTDNYESWNGSAWTGIGGGAATNAIINGAFEINQRNFTSSTVSTLGFDRFESVVGGDGTVTYSAQSFTVGELDVPTFGTPKRFARLVTSGQTNAASRAQFATKIENVSTLAGQTVTFSFYAKAGSGTPSVALELFQVFGTGGSSSVSIPLGKVAISSSWNRYSLSVAIPSISGKTIGTSDSIQANLFVSAGSDFNARASTLGIQNNTFDIWGVQLEAGSVATPFRRNANSLQGELAACQRYYFRQGGTGNLLGDTGVAYSTSAAIVPCGLPVEMRVAPTSVEFSNIALNDGVTSRNMTNVALYAGSNQFTAGLNVFGGSGLTQFRPYFLMAQSGVSGFIAYSAEL
jgi:hypothetical protein